MAGALIEKPFQKNSMIVRDSEEAAMGHLLEATFKPSSLTTT